MARPGRAGTLAAMPAGLRTEAAPAPAVPRRPAQRPGRRERLVFRVAMGVVAAYVIDDAAGHPEPGTGLGDHVASLLVVLALIAASVLLQARARAGVRAAIGILWGLLAVVAGVADGLRPIGLGRMSGDDAAAALAALAGAVLAAQGAVTLWRSRRLDERRPRRYARRALVGAGAALAAIFVVIPIAVAIVATHRARGPVAAADLGRPATAVALRTADGLRLRGWYVPSRNRAAVVVVPGRTGTVRHAAMLARHGYGVLLFDRRGEGESEGDFNALGWGGGPDIAAAVGFLGRRPDVDPDRIGGLGLSVGGELLLEAAARDPRLRAVVSEGAGVRSMAEQLENPDAPAWLRWLSPMAIETAAVAVLSSQSPPDGLAGLVPKIAPRAVLLIRARHGNADEALNAVYSAAAGRPKTLWTVPAGGHTGGLAGAPAAYRRRVLGFFDRTLLRRDAPG